MGYLVDDYCHETLADAKAAAYDAALVNSSAIYVDGVGYVALIPSESSIGNSDETFRLDVVLADSGFPVSGVDVPFASCDVEGEFMPWASSVADSMLFDAAVIGSLAFAFFAGFMKGGQR